MASILAAIPVQPQESIEQPQLADNGFRNPKTAFNPDIDSLSGEEIVQQLRHVDSSLKVYTQSSPQYDSLRAVYNQQITARPQAICRPTTVAQVQAIVRAAADMHVSLTVRSIGHAFFGQSCVNNAVMLDMREMDSLSVSQDQKTVQVGGGALTRNLIGYLDAQGLVTASSTAGCIGWTGWALGGGYGPLNSYTGFGVDNILSAKVVTADGNVVEADGSSDLLWGLRGAGGNLGVVVESTVRTYALPAMLGGRIQYKQAETAKALLGLQRLIEQGVPQELCLQLELTNRNGMMVDLIAGWMGDLNEGQKWMDTVRDIAETELDTVEQTTFNALQGMTSQNIPQFTHTTTRGVSVPRLTPEVISILEQSMSETHQYTVTGLLNYGKGAQSNSSSSFGLREPHVLFFINARDEAARMPEASGWVNGLADQIKATGQTMKSSYANFATPEERVDESFGGNWTKLQELKGQVDPENVFQFAQPKLAA